MGIAEQIHEIWSLRISEPAVALSRGSLILADFGDQLTAADKVRLHAVVAAASASLGRFAEAMNAVDAADVVPVAEWGGAEDLEFELRRVRSRSALLDMRHSEGLKLALINLDLAVASGQTRMLAAAHSDVASAFGISGNLRKALKHLQESLQRTPEANSVEYGALLNNLGNVYMSLNRVEEAAACFAGARQAFRQVGHRMQTGLALSNEGRAMALQGKPERAIELQEEALGLFEAGGFGHLVVATLYKLAENLAETGKAEQAEAKFLLALSRMADGNSGGYEDEVRNAYGRFLIARQRPREASEQFRKALELVSDGGSSHKVARLLEQVASAQQAAGDIAEALQTSKQLLQLRDRMDQEPVRPGNQTELVELELALEREAELMQATGSALVEANRQLAVKSKQLAELAMTDYLTGLHNRRYFSAKLEEAVSGSRARGGAFSVIFIDVDNFKAVNDDWGHETGDLVLQQLARLFRAVVRESDVVARWGGEEFAILLPGAGSKAAHAVADKVRQAVNAHDWSPLGAGLEVTMSAGVISSSDHPGASADQVMQIADTLLYRAKFAGRNRIIRSVNGPPPEV